MIKHDIFQLEISVDYMPLMQVSYCQYYLNSVYFDNIFAESLTVLVIVSKIASCDVWHYKIDSRLVVKQIDQVDEERIFVLRQDVFLKGNVRDELVID